MMDQLTADTAAGTIATDDRAKRKSVIKEAKRVRKKRRKEGKRKKKKLKLCPDEVKSSAGVTIDAAEWNSNLVTKAKQEFEKNKQTTSQTSITSIRSIKEEQTEKEIAARAGSSITATKKKRMSWDERHMQLQLYKVEHGDCLVPRNYKNRQLARWVDRQRHEYSKYKRNLPSAMTKKRIAELEAVDFVWDAYKFAWKSNVMEMIVYREIYGDCLVPTVFPPRPTLGTWVHKQRTEYEKFRKQQPSQMTQARIERLEAEEFVWQVNTPWDYRYHELLEYRKTHDNCRVPTRFAANPQLGEWVTTQRKEYRRLKNGEKRI